MGKKGSGRLVSHGRYGIQNFEPFEGLQVRQQVVRKIGSTNSFCNHVYSRKILLADMIRQQHFLGKFVFLFPTFSIVGTLKNRSRYYEKLILDYS